MMKRGQRLRLLVLAMVGVLGSGCCPELREIFQKEAIDVTEDQTFSITTPDCFDTQKEVLFAVLWKSGKHGALVQLDGLDVAEFPEQTCDLVSQAAKALGDAIGGAIDDVLGDVGCAVHLFPGPDFERDDRTAIQELTKEGLSWQVFKLPKDTLQVGSNNLLFDVSSTENCTGTDGREATRMAYVLMSDVDNACDEKFRN